MNLSADPCEDFYNYACGGVSEDYTSIIFTENIRILKNGLKKLLTADNNDNLMSSEAVSKAVQFYSTCVREENASDVTQYIRNTVDDFLQTFNLPDVKFFFDANADVNIDRTNFSEILRFVYDVFHDEPFFSTGFSRENENPDTLGYLKFSNVMQTFRVKYDCGAQDQLLETFVGGVRTVMDTLKLNASKREVKKAARELMELELELLGLCNDDENEGHEDDSAESEGEDSISSDDETDTNLTELNQLTFKNWNFDFDNYIKKFITYGAGENTIDFDTLRVSVHIHRLPKILENTNDATLLRYVVFRYVFGNASYTKDPDCTKVLDLMPFVKNRIYTESKYSSVTEREALRSLVTTIIGTIKTTLKNMVISMPWIQQDKKAYRMLVKKFNKMKYNVAIESDMLNNTWIDKYYEQIEFNDDDKFLDMMSKVIKFASYGIVRALAHPTGNVEADTTKNNAFYNSLFNKFVINDGMLVAPLYHSKYPLSYNLGTVGSTIGHEISHSVDSNNINVDDTGSFSSFSETVAQEFKEMADCLVDFYNAIQVLPSNYTPNSVNGLVTLGENMADISGLDAAYRTFKILEKKYGQEARLRHHKLSGLTQDQIFFIGLASQFCEQKDDETTYKLLLMNDVHTPNKARVQGNLQNLPAFWKAFKCPVGSKYRPESYCKVWTP